MLRLLPCALNVQACAHRTRFDIADVAGRIGQIGQSIRKHELNIVAPKAHELDEAFALADRCLPRTRDLCSGFSVEHLFPRLIELAEVACSCHAPGKLSAGLRRLLHLIGVAGGGFVALDYAAWHPERLSSLIVGASTGSVSDKEIQDVIRRIEIPGIRDLPAHFREVGASYRGTNPEGTKRWLDIHERARQKDAPTQPLRSPNTFAKLETITTRTLVIAADADLLAPPGLMTVWARHLKGAQWTTVMDAGHSIAWEQPAAFNEIVIRFLKGGRPFPAVLQ